MNVVQQERKFGNFIEVTLDDGRVLMSPDYSDNISLAAALRMLAASILADPNSKPTPTDG